MGKRFKYNTDTWHQVGINTYTMTGSVMRIKPFYATFTVATHNTTTKVMTLSSVDGNLADEGQITVLDVSDGVATYVFSYDNMTMSGTTATLHNVKQVTTGAFTIQAGTDTGVHNYDIPEQEGIVIYNDSGADIAVGFNANIAVGGMGIQIANRAEEELPVTEDVEIYVVGSTGDMTILGYK